MIYLKTAEEIELMRGACDLVSRTLGEMARWVAPGVTGVNPPAWVIRVFPERCVSR